MGRRLPDGRSAVRGIAFWWRRLSRGDRTRLLVAASVAVAIVVGYAVQAARENEPARGAIVSLRSPDAELARIQLGYTPEPTNGTLRRTASLLDLLQADCPSDSRRRLAQLTKRAMQTLRRDGLVATPNQVLGAVLSTPDMGSRAECVSFFELYVERSRRAGKALR